MRDIDRERDTRETERARDRETRGSEAAREEGRDERIAHAITHR